MNDQTTAGLPDIPRDRSLEKRGEDNVGIEPLDRLARHRVIYIEFDRNIVAALSKRDVQPLRQAVEAVDEEQDAHWRSADPWQLLAGEPIDNTSAAESRGHLHEVTVIGYDLTNNRRLEAERVTAHRREHGIC